MKARRTWVGGMQTDLKEWRRAEGGEEEMKGVSITKQFLLLRRRVSPSIWRERGRGWDRRAVLG